MTANIIQPNNAGTRFQKVYANLIDENDVQIGVQYPLSTDGDSVYAKDIDTTNSDIGDFSGTVTDLFDSRTSTITTSTDNPTLTIALKRPIINHEITLVTSSGNFSNVKIIAKNAAGTTLETIDDSSNNTKYTSRTYNFVDIDKWCEVDISFTTTDDVTLSYLCIPKTIRVDSNLIALKPDGTDTHIGATAGGNLKIAVEEFDTSVDPVRTNLEGGGVVNVGTAAVEATFTGTTKSIIITADKDNTGTLYVGKSDVTSAGANAITFLEVGDSIVLSYDDVDNAVYVVGSDASQKFWKGALL